MVTARHELFKTLSRLGNGLIEKNGEEPGTWEIWFAGDDYGLTPEQFRALCEDNEDGYMYESHCIARFEGDAMVSRISTGHEQYGLNVLTMFLRIFQEQAKLIDPDPYIVDVEFDLRVNGEQIDIDVIAVEIGSDSQGMTDPELPLHRWCLGRFVYDPVQQCIAAREVRPKPVRGRPSWESFS